MTDRPAKPADQAKLLVALQDLDQMIKEAEDAETSGQLKEMGFSLDGVAALRSAREELAGRIKPQLLNRYERVSRNYDRVIVPVTGELCLGCHGDDSDAGKSGRQFQMAGLSGGLV